MRSGFQNVISSSNVKTSYHIATECTIKRPRFQNCSAVPTSKTLRQNASLGDLLSSSNIQRIISNTARKHHVASLFSKVSLQFQLPKHRFK